jgi:signal transduction histidine kinase
MLAEERGQHFILEGDPALFLHADRMLLQRAIGNILENAVKYSPPSTSIFVRVQECFEAGDAHVLLEIEDEGEVIPEALHQKIFDRFFRIEASRSRDAGGTGLGLAIAKWGVTANGGTIALVPGRSRGNCFSIKLIRFTKQAETQNQPAP